MRRLSSSQVEQLAADLAELGQAELPLPEGLEAAAEETGGNVANAMRAIAASLQQGKPLNDALAEQRNRLPAYLAGYVAAAAQTGDFGGALCQMLENRRSRRELYGAIWSAIAYPLLLFGVALCVCLFVAVAVVPGNRQMMEEFGLSLPLITVLLFWMCEFGIWWLLGIIAVAAAFVVIGRSLVGDARWDRWKARVPLFGRLSHWSGVAEFSRLLAVLLDHRIPLPRALAAAADGTSNADVAAKVRLVTHAAQQGGKLAEAVRSTRRLPAVVAPFVHWGEQSGALAEAFHAVAELFEERVRIRSSMLRSVLPPVVFVMIVLFASFVIGGLFLPLVDLISSLSGDGW